MKQQLRALQAEFIKNRHSKIRWVTFAAMSLAPLFGGVFMLMMTADGYEGLSGAFKTKAVMMSFEANWPSFLGLLTQAIGVGGVLIFGFVVSWLFGREYADGTIKDLLALPISRTTILHAKFIYYSLWCLALALYNLMFGLIIGFAVQLDGWSMPMFLASLESYVITTILIILLNTPIAFFALWGKGYLTPLGIVAILLVLAQVIGVMGMGSYFPWSVPGLYSGSGGPEMMAQVNEISFGILIATSLMGYVASLLWWRYADQK